MLRCLSDVENLTEAISTLGKADFTGVAALEITGDMKRMRWEVINPWHLCRPSIHAPWMYNANADPVPIAPEMLEAESVILREALPMHLPAMFLIVAKRHGVQAWDAFLDKFGIPAAFFETPPGATEEEAMEFDATVQKLIGEGSGTIPSGAKLHTFETARDNTQTFEARARWCDDALLQLILGGKLTMTTEAGSGTLAGNAHQESFERLCAATARSISECINRQFCRRVLREAFPDQPQLALFDLSAQKQEDLASQAQLIATLSYAGFRPSAETVSEMMGFEVTESDPTHNVKAFNPGISPITNRETDDPTTPDASAPLTEQELAALQSLSKGFAAEQLEADADTIYTALADAIAPEEAQEEEPVANSCNQYKHEPGCNGGASTSEKKEKETEKKAAETHSEKQPKKQDADKKPDKKPEKKSKKEALEEVSATPAGKSIRDTLDKLNKRPEGDEPSHQHIGFKQVEPKTAAKVTEFYGGDYSDYEHSIAEKDIQHAKQRHPDLTDDDFMLIPDITENWDKMVAKPSKKKGYRVNYKKTYGDTTYTLAERVGSRRKDNPRLMFTTIYFNKTTN